MKKLIFTLFPIIFSILCISAQSYEIAVLPFKSSSNQGKNQNYYFQPGNQLLAEIYSYEVKGRPSTRLVGKLNTGENLNLSKLLYPDNTETINLESDKTYQIIFSGNLHFVAIEFDTGNPDGFVDIGYPVNYDFEFYGTDTFTLRPNETNIIQVDIAGPPRILFTNWKTSNMSRFTKMRWQLQVTNK